MRFPDRSRAGQLLAEKLSSYANRKDVAVVALPPGGVLVGYEIANALNAPLDILVIRNLRVPENPVLVMGAVCADGTHVLSHEVIRWLKVTDATIDAAITTELAESERLDKAYRGGAERVEIAGKTAILVDDGIETASAMRTAVSVLRLRRPTRIITAAPVANASAVLELRARANDVVTCIVPDEFDGVHQWYEDFRAISDESVRDLYERGKRRAG
jgi:putative phosphoribosyl transferase